MDLWKRMFLFEVGSQILRYCFGITNPKERGTCEERLKSNSSLHNGRTKKKDGVFAKHRLFSKMLFNYLRVTSFSEGYVITVNETLRLRQSITIGNFPFRFGNSFGWDRPVISWRISCGCYSGKKISFINCFAGG